eukprot:990561-Amphidinium_carterae.1
MQASLAYGHEIAWTPKTCQLSVEQAKEQGHAEEDWRDNPEADVPVNKVMDTWKAASPPLEFVKKRKFADAVLSFWRLAGPVLDR